MWSRAGEGIKPLVGLLISGICGASCLTIPHNAAAYFLIGLPTLEIRILVSEWGLNQKTPE